MGKAPYKFLDYYTFEDRDIFFGREKETQQMVGEILSTRLLVLFSPSGSGKTSLINAGVRPQLEDMGYQTVYTRLETDPVPSVKNAVLNALKKAETENNEDLHTFLTRTTQQIQKPLVIFIDQFEEFFLILRDKTGLRQEFIDQLAQIKYDDQLPVFLVLSLREDYFVDLHEFREKIPSIFQNNANIRLEPFTDDEARRAIINPLKVVEHTIEPALVDTLINDLKNKHAGIEPITLQMVCCTLWNAKPENGQQLDLALYEKCGKAEKIIDNYVKERLDAIPWHEQRLMIKIFNALKTPDNTKQMRSYEVLLGILQIKRTSRLQKLLKKLRQNHILREEERQGTRWYEFKHDYLVEKISEWIKIITERRNQRKLYYATIPGLTLLLGLLIYFFIDYNTFYASFTDRKYSAQRQEIVIFRGSFFKCDSQTIGYYRDDIRNYKADDELKNHLKLSFIKKSDWRFIISKINQAAAGKFYFLMGEKQIAIDTLVAALRDNDNDVRSQAAVALGAIGQVDATVISALMAALRDKWGSFCYEAGGALVKLGQADTAVIQALVAALRDEQGDVRYQAVRVLGMIGQADATVMHALVAALRDNDSNVRSQAADALGDIGQADAAVIQALVAALWDEQGDIRDPAARVLGMLGKADAAVIQALVVALRDNDNDVRSQAAEALIKLGHLDAAVIQTLVAALRDENWIVRSQAAGALGEIGQADAAVIQALVAALRDEERSVRSHAAGALGELGQTDAAVIQALVAALRDKEEIVQYHAALALVKLGQADAAVIQALVAALRDEQGNICSSAAWALVKLGQADAAVIQTLLAALRDNDVSVRSHAARALGEIGKTDAAVIQMLLAALQDNDEFVRSQAARALGKLGQADVMVIPMIVAALRDNDGSVSYQAAWALGKLWKNQPISFLLNEFQNPMSGYRTAAAYALTAKNFILQDSITLKKIDELREQDKRPRVRLAAWNAYELVQEKREYFEEGQKNYAKAQKNIHRADSLFIVGKYFYAMKNYENAFDQISEKSREDSLKTGKVKFNESRCTAFLNRPGQTIENLKTAFEYNPAYKDTLQAAIQRGDKEWAIIKDNWYLNQVLLRKKSPPKK